AHAAEQRPDRHVVDVQMVQEIRVASKAEAQLREADQVGPEDVAAERQEDSYDHVGEGRGEIGPDLPPGDRQVVLHAAPSVPPLMIPMKMSSRLRATGRCSRSPQPSATARSAICSRTSRTPS